MTQLAFAAVFGFFSVVLVAIELYFYFSCWRDKRNIKDDSLKRIKITSKRNMRLTTVRTITLATLIVTQSFTVYYLYRGDQELDSMKAVLAQLADAKRGSVDQ
jgi:cell division protein FtsB